MKKNLTLNLLSSIAFMGIAGAVFASDSAPGVSPDAALAKLVEGNERFVSGAVSAGKPNAAKRAETAKGQHPFAIIVGCADSRTSPELIFDENLGDLFVIRSAGNLVDDHALGSIEYAVEHLGASLVVVLGHERCGAVTAALASGHAPGHVESIVHDIQPAVLSSKGKAGEPLDCAIGENARLVAARIRSEMEVGERAKTVRVVSAVYDLDTGKVAWAKE